MEQDKLERANQIIDEVNRLGKGLAVIHEAIESNLPVVFYVPERNDGQYWTLPPSVVSSLRSVLHQQSVILRNEFAQL